MLARVRRLGLYGWYRSSNAVIVSARSISARSSSLSLPCSSIDLSTAWRRSSRARNFSTSSLIWRSCSSSRLRVASLR